MSCSFYNNYLKSEINSCTWKVIQIFRVIYDDTLHTQKQVLILPLTPEENDYQDPAVIKIVCLFLHGLIKSWKR